MTPQRQSDGRAVSPVVGVALLIGITVILAAVVGTAVFGVGPADTPQVTLSFEVTEDDEVELVHEGGDPLDHDMIVVRDEDGREYGIEDDLVTGERQTIVDDEDPLDIAETDVERLTVVWQTSGGDTESTLATFKL